MIRLRQLFCCCQEPFCGCTAPPDTVTVTVEGIEFATCIAYNDWQFGGGEGAVSMLVSDELRVGGTYDLPRITSSESSCIWRKQIGTATTRTWSDSACTQQDFPIPAIVRAVFLQVARSTPYGATTGGHSGVTMGQATATTQWQVIMYSQGLGHSYSTFIWFGMCVPHADTFYEAFGRVLETGACCNDTGEIANGFATWAECSYGSSLTNAINRGTNCGHSGTAIITPGC